MMWWWHDGSFSWWWMGLGWLWMVVFWGGLLAVGAWVIRSLVGPTRSQEGSHRLPLDIAGERYARGDISQEEFEEIKRNLQS